MQEDDNLRKTVRFFAALASVSISIILIIIGVASSNTTLKIVLISIGTSLIAASLASTFGDFFSLSHYMITSSPRALGGLKSVYRNIDEANKNNNLTDKLRKAKRVFLMCNTGKFAVKYYFREESLQEIAKNGCQLRLIISASEHPALAYKEGRQSYNPINDPRQQVKEVENFFRKYIEYLVLTKSFSASYDSTTLVEIRATKYIIMENCLFIDDNMLRLTPYQTGKSSADCSIFDFAHTKENDIFAQYKAVFDNIWDNHSVSILRFPQLPIARTNNNNEAQIEN